MYEDDLDNAEDVVYTGQGGHNLTGDKRQMRDQKLERGNLALKFAFRGKERSEKN
ncbi:Histone-lysine N-methyltransferase H3 lysine-9 specific SUVH4-like [Trifolium medium]|uniref:Histone-lysine N-methyltransferase H3 lysine-9 specific SUVH4-like n=1 Tax=Trifolium medium TaxID=97028 RepID=A0A392QPY9_9FABA|nr:Histone-lysine N-methyltransferase H3 lysine-9 specific SUVH4-like [Trifolium medium]